MSSMGRSLQSTGRTLTTHLGLPLLAVGALATKAAVDFQSSMELIHTQAGVSQKAVDALSGSVLKLAGPTATAPEELSKGLYHLSSQGLRGAKALEALKIAAEGAKIGQADLEDVTNGLGAVLASGIKGSQNYSQAMGQLNAVVGAGDMRMQDLADALGTGLPAKAAVAGVSLRDVGAALAVFGDNNIRGAEAGTQLNSTLRLMEGPSKAAAKAMHEYGISAAELGTTLSTKGLVPALTILQDKLSGLSRSAKFSALAHMFGGRQAGGVLLLLDQMERLKQKEKDVEAGGKKFGDSWSAYTKTAAYHLSTMGASMQAAGISIGTILLPLVSAAANKIAGWAQAFQGLSSGVKTAILVLAGVGIVIGPLLSVIGSIVTVVGALASPIGIVVAAVALLTAGIVAAGLAPDKLKSALERMGLSAHTASEVVFTLQAVFMAVAKAAEFVAGEVRDHWAQIRAFTVSAFDAVRSIVDNTVRLIRALWHTFGADITSFTKTTLANVVQYIKGEFNVIEGLFRLVTDVLHGRWSKAWDDVKQIVRGAVQMVGAALGELVAILETQAKIAGTALWKGIKWGVDQLSKLPVWLQNEIERGVTAVLAWAAGEAQKLGHAIMEGVIHGIGGLGGALKHALTSTLGDAYHGAMSFLGINSPSKLFRENVGKGISEGIIVGYLEGLRPLPGHISRTLREALEAGRREVESIVRTYKSAWENLTQDANKAFDALNKVVKTKSGELLAGLESVHNKADARMGLITAKAGLSDAQQAASTGSPDQVKALADATTAAKLAQNHLAEAQTRVQLAQDAVNEAITKYGADSDQATAKANALAAAQDAVTQSTEDLQNAQDNVVTAQADIPHQSDEVAAAFAKMQAAQDALNAAVDKYGPASKQAVAAQKQLQNAMVGAQTVVSAEGTGPQQDKDQAVIDAQKTLDDIIYAEQVAALQKSDAQERAAAKARAAARKLEFDQDLKALEKHLQDEHASHDKAQKAILKLFKEFGISYRASGLALGTEFAKGMAQAMGVVTKAIEAIAAEIAKYLPHSPAEKGPLSELPNWENFIPVGLPGAVDTASAMMAGLNGPSPGARAGHGAAAAAGGGIHLTIQGSLIGATPEQLGEQLGRIVEPYLGRRRVALTV
jgi:TP901 family phage tail tape measure protein